MLLVLSAVVALAADSPPRIVRGFPFALRVEAKAAVFLECRPRRELVGVLPGYRRWWCNEQKPTCLGVHGRMEDRSGL
jgi:hypothetical protein